MINTLKKQDNGWVVNNTKYVTDVDGATGREEVLAYIAEGGAVDPEFTLDEVKDQRCASMLQSLKQAVAEDVTYNSVVYQSGDRTRENLVMAIANYISAANSLPANFEWIAKDNSGISFTTTNISELAEIVGTQWSTGFANYQTRKGEIRAVSTGDNAADIITVNAIGW